MPLAWDELSAELKSSRYTVANAVERLKRLKRDPWEEYWRTAQTIPADTTAALDAL